MRIVFEVAGDKQIEREILRVGQNTADASPAFEAIADFLMAETEKQFSSEGAHASGGWKPLSFTYLAEKRRRFAKGQVKSLAILRATDALHKSLTVRGDTNQILDVQPDSLELGSTLPYGAVHQNPRAGNPLPRRRPLEFTETARRDTVKILQRWIMTGRVEP